MCEKSQKNNSNSLESASSRRSFIQRACVLTAGVPLLTSSKKFLNIKDSARSDQKTDIKYYLHIQLSGGMDVQYMFDARPLEMTDKKLIANYHTKDPILMVGSNGQSTWRTTLVDPLMKWFDRFSVVNGVVMSSNLDGHEQGTNLVFTGNPFGGESFIPWANQNQFPLDYVLNEFPFSQITNSGGGMRLTPKSCKSLAKKMATLSDKTDLTSAVKRRAERFAAGKSSLAQSSSIQSSSLGKIPTFATSFSSLKISDPESASNPRDTLLSETKSNCEMFTELMRVGITNNAILTLSTTDSHDVNSAKSLPELVSTISEALALVFEHLNATLSPSGRSMLDDTTLLITSEFGRTMRQPYAEFSNSGTDHNMLTNTFIVGGRGIKGGQVFGESDFRTSEETLSDVHLICDPMKYKIMGRSFDFSTNSIMPSPQQFDPKLYLSPMNVMNTVQEVLGIPKDKRFLFGRGLPEYPMITGLLG